MRAVGRSSCSCPPVAGSLEFNAGVRNALGRAERLDVAAEWGSKGSNEYSVALSQPRVGGRPITVEARIAQLFRNFTRHSSFTEQLRQAAVTVSTCACSASLSMSRGLLPCSHRMASWLLSHISSGRSLGVVTAQ
jgi:hypothetical protein